MQGFRMVVAVDGSISWERCENKTDLRKIVIPPPTCAKLTLSCYNDLLFAISRNANILTRAVIVMTFNDRHECGIAEKHFQKPRRRT